MKLINRIYSTWVTFWFILFFLMLFPFFYIFLQNKSWYPAAHNCNRIWGFMVFLFSFIWFDRERRFKPNKQNNYVYVANHSSYLDIPTLYLTIPGDISFIGKSSLGKVPLFGYMYSRLHILVDRAKKNSRYDSVLRAMAKIETGGNVVLFAEGTIPADAPVLAEFKDGAFRIAIEKQIPLVPVTIPYNWIILPDDGKFLAKRHTCKVVVHEPIDTQGLTLDDIGELKNKVFNIIEAELIAHLGDDYRQRKSKKDSTLSQAGV